MNLSRLLQIKVHTLRHLRALLRNTPLRSAIRLRALSRSPIIIGGCGRSGTTLLLSILSCHERIYAINEETHYLCPGAWSPAPDFTALPRFDLLLGHLYEKEREIPETCRRWCEKSPKNVLFFGSIIEYFGRRARLIHVVRDGRDVITSRHPSDPSRYWVPPKRWIKEVAAGVKFQHHPQVLTIRYEDLVRCYERSMKGICSFIGEDFTDAFKKYPESATVKRHVGWSKEGEALNETSIGRWRDSRLSDRVRELISDERAVSLLRHFDYLE